MKKLHTSIVLASVVALAMTYRVLFAGVQPSIGLYYTASSDPTTGAGQSAPLWQLLIRTDSPSIYYKSGSSNTSWTKLGTGGTGSFVTASTLTPGTLPVATGAGSIGDSDLSQAANVLSTADGMTFTSSSRDITYTNAPTGKEAYTGVHFERTDEHLDGNRVSTVTYNTFQTVTLTGGSTQYTQDTTTASWGNRVGVHILGTGNTATGSVVEITNPNSINFGQTAKAIYEGLFLFPTLSTATDEYTFISGFFDTTTSVNQVDGCWIQYDRGNVATSGPNTSNLNDWECWCASNSVRTACVMDGTSVCGGFTTVAQPVAAGSAPSTNWYHLKTVVTSNTEADFYVNGVLSCKITSNIPTGSGRNTGAGQAWRKSAGTTTLFYYIDWNQLLYNLLSPRSP